MEMHDEFDERRRGKHVVPLRCYQCMYHNLSNTGLSSATIGAISFWIGDLELGFGEKVGAGEKLLEEKKKKKKKAFERLDVEVEDLWKKKVYILLFVFLNRFWAEP